MDLVFSNQLMEHLHPDDAEAELQSIFTALKPAGYYVCITPNRLTGPHDISRDFEESATGLHLKEYSTSELDSLFRRTGPPKDRAASLHRGSTFPFQCG